MSAVTVARVDEIPPGTIEVREDRCITGLQRVAIHGVERPGAVGSSDARPVRVHVAPPPERLLPMSAPATAVVRVYNVGFGDSILLDLPAPGRRIKILIDCGSVAFGDGAAMRGWGGGDDVQ